MTALEKMAAEGRELVMKLIDQKAQEVARRDNLDLRNPTDLVTAYSRACNEDRGLYDLYRRVISVPVGSTLLND